VFCLKNFFQKLSEIAKKVGRFFKILGMLLGVLLIIGYLTGAVIYFIFPLFHLVTIEPFWFMIIGVIVFGFIVKSPKKGKFISWIVKKFQPKK
jgi:hypothetical protein